jgi:hypothetical protein
MWSDIRYFTTVENDREIPKTMDLSIKAKFNIVTKTLSLVDMIAEKYNTALELELENIKGIFKVTCSAGVIYENQGFESGDFSEADILGSDLAWELTGIELPLDSSGNVLKSAYVIEYKLSADGEGKTNYSFSGTYNNVYVSPSIQITALVDIQKSTMVVTNATNYGITMNGTTYQPTGEGTEKVTTVAHPLGSGQPNVVSYQTSFVVGANLWTGIYSIQNVSTLYYDFPASTGLSVELYDQVKGLDQTYKVEADEAAYCVENCLLTLTSNYEAAKLNNLRRAQEIKRMIDDIMLYYDMYKLAVSTGNSTAYAISHLKSLMTLCGCCNQSVTDKPSIEVIPVSGGTSGGSSTTSIPPFRKYLSAGEQIITVPSEITETTLIMINGDILDTDQYSGLGTLSLSLVKAGNENDKLIVIY